MGGKISLGGVGWRKRLPNNLTYAIILVVGGDIAQLGERCLRMAEVGGSNPPISTNHAFFLSRHRKTALVSSRTGKMVAASKTTISQSKPPKGKVWNECWRTGV